MKQVILVVDDMVENIELLDDILGNEYEVRGAVDGYQALQIAMSQNQPDLILLDVMMPGLDGYEVCRRLKAQPKTRGIPIIFITARNAEKDETRGFECGAVDYIKKPFSMPIVRARIRNHLELKNQRKRIESHTRQLKETLEALDIRNRFIRQIFGRYLSDDIVDTILETPEGICIGGEKREVTLLMSDLRDFTSIGETLSAEEVVGIVNIYLEIMTDIIFKYGGTIDEIIGDAILAIFGAPVNNENHAQRAVSCALEMQLAITDVNRRCRDNGFPEVQQGIAINSGPVVVGNIGSSKRSKYGVVGRNVNLTGRIEAYTLGGQILVTDSTWKACGRNLRVDDQFEVRPKGMNRSIIIYEIGGITGDYNIALPEKQSIVMQKLIHPLNIHFKILMEDIAVGKVYKGKIIALDEMAAEIESNRGFRKLTNLDISILDDEGNIEAIGLIARVIDAATDSHLISRVTFVSVSPQARSALEFALEEID
jgi:class 3 adenylate cyclase